MKKYFPFFFFLLGSCSYRVAPELSKVHLTSANGLTQTITAKDRIKTYSNENYLVKQPFSKVIRIYGPHESKKILTTYHPNGQLFQRLECENNQAKGEYKEWSPQGQLRVQAFLIGGPPDVDENAQASWIFHGFNKAYDQGGNLIAEFYYENGLLEKTGKTFYSNGSSKETFPYQRGLLNGEYTYLSTSGQLLKKARYKQGIREGLTLTYWKPKTLASKEEFLSGRLVQGYYFSELGKLIGQVNKGSGSRIIQADEGYFRVEYKDGEERGLVEVFSSQNELLQSYSQSEGLKEGAELIYEKGIHHPMLRIEWKNGVVQGRVTTWYPSGQLESEREMSQNKKQGYFTAYYPSGDLMLLEEYHQDSLIRGQYFKKGAKTAISEIISGNGEAYLFDKEGLLRKRVLYEEGHPIE